MAYLNKPLEENEKVPLSRYSMTTLVSGGEPTIMCNEHDLQQIFRSSEDEESDYLCTILKTAIVSSVPDSDDTEASFNFFWDDNIRKIIAAIFAPDKFIRGSNWNTSTASRMSDFGVLHQGVFIFRGEEKAPCYSGRHPKNELFDKLVWTYDPASWILGQYFNVTLYSIILIFFLSRVPCC
jgi:hypothetical protein